MQYNTKQRISYHMNQYHIMQYHILYDVVLYDFIDYHIGNEDDMSYDTMF